HRGWLGATRRLGPGAGRDDPSWYDLGRSAVEHRQSEVAFDALSEAEDDLLANTDIESRRWRRAAWSLGWEFERLGYPDRARTIWRLSLPGFEAVAAEDPDNSDAWLDLAVVFALIGEEARALDALDRSVVEGLRNVAYLEESEALNAIRGHERFQAALEGARRNLAEREAFLHDQGLVIP
ncbi:MAG: hypothetical protein VYC34_00545, partial [Planctomycetota bacterium]|nr:hypothetical protein [Planctomycetota bacterium]